MLTREGSLRHPLGSDTWDPNSDLPQLIGSAPPELQAQYGAIARRLNARSDGCCREHGDCLEAARILLANAGMSFKFNRFGFMFCTGLAHLDSVAEVFIDATSN